MSDDEQVVVRVLGGPHDGDDRKMPRSVLGWPPPSNLPGKFKGGIYHLTHFQSDGEHKTAEYQWRATVG